MTGKAQPFLRWLAEGIRSQQHTVNTPSSFLHTVPEGLLLMPRAFQAYSPKGWEDAQKSFLELKLHKKTPDGGGIWRYNVPMAGGTTGVRNGFLIGNLQALLDMSAAEPPAPQAQAGAATPVPAPTVEAPPAPPPPPMTGNPQPTGHGLDDGVPDGLPDDNDGGGHLGDDGWAGVDGNGGGLPQHPPAAAATPVPAPIVEAVEAGQDAAATPANLPASATTDAGDTPPLATTAPTTEPTVAATPIASPPEPTKARAPFAGLFRRALSALGLRQPPTAHPTAPPTPPPASLSLPPGIWPVLTAAELLAPHAKLVGHIRKLSGSSDGNWAAVYQPLLDNFAGFVQETPASESHHHCGRGGLLAHSLQVMKAAMDARKGKMLPPGAAAEDINTQLQAWTYAIASAALLHDVGKPCSDYVLHLHTAGGQDTHQRWEPMGGALKPGTAYRVGFVRGREYSTHQLLPPLLAHKLMPAAGLNWLQQGFPGVFRVWLGYLSGQDDVAGVLGQIVAVADRLSTADDLMGGGGRHTRQIPAARTKPLSHRLLVGLWYLLDSGQLPTNRKGAPVFFDGADLWLMSKRVMDELRLHLESEGQTGIPANNTRIMDELQQHGLLTPTATNQAIWNATVTLGGWSQAFTLLRLPAHHLWTDPAQYPPAWEGSITSKDGDATTAAQPTAHSRQEAAADTPAAGTVPDGASDGDGLEFLPVAAARLPPSGGDGPRWDEDDGGHPLPPPVQRPIPTASPAAPVRQPAPPAAQPQHTPAIIFHEATGDANGDAGQQFLYWLSDGLRRKRHPTNAQDAFLHTVREGLLLVSPRVFQAYAPDNWKDAQNAFQRLKLHTKHPGGRNLWPCTVRGQDGVAASVLNCILLENPLGALGLAHLPPPNKSLSLPDRQPEGATKR